MFVTHERIETQRTRLRQKYGGDIAFVPLTNGLRPGDVVDFDVTEYRQGGRKEVTFKHGIVFDQLERTDEATGSRIREVSICTPAIRRRDGTEVTPERIYRRLRSTVNRCHGGPGHEVDFDS